MATPSIRVHQIYFRRAQAGHLDPDFIPYDNTANPRPDLAEYHVFRTAHQAGLTQQADHVGFVSWRFGAKTGITGRQFLDFIAAHPGYDVYFINPFPHVAHMYANPWLGAEDNNPGTLQFVQRAFDAIGYRIDLAALPNDPERTGYSNYWAGSPEFWRRYMAFAEPLYHHLEAGLTPEDREFLIGPANYTIETTQHAFILERLFPTLLQTDRTIRSLRYVHPPAESAYGSAAFLAERHRIIADGSGQDPRRVEARVEAARAAFRERVLAANQPALTRQRRIDLLKRMVRPSTLWPTLLQIAPKAANRTIGRIARGATRRLALARASLVDLDRVVLAQRDGGVPLASASPLCVYAHFDPQNRVDPYVLHMLRAYRELGCATVFVTTCAGIAATELDAVRPLVSRMMVRKNVGHDFGSWHLGLRSAGDLTAYPQVILTNDSIYGPVHPLAPMFEAMATKPLDVWGATDSWEMGHHLQSCFLVFNAIAVRHPFFSGFWSRFRFVTNRQAVIDEYELGLSQSAEREGLRIGAYCEFREVRALHLARNPTFIGDPGEYGRRIRRDPVNPLHCYWDTLIEAAGCPFVKVNLLRDNIPLVPPVLNWQAVLQRVNPEIQALIANHLRRVAPQRPSA